MRQCSSLGDLPTGTKFRLYAKHRDGSPRPRFRYGPAKGGGRYLAGETLVVGRTVGDAVICTVGKLEVPVWVGMRVML